MAIVVIHSRFMHNCRNCHNIWYTGAFGDGDRCELCYSTSVVSLLWKNIAELEP